MKIWRYMPLSHYVNMVARSKLYVPITRRLSDPMEGIWFNETENHFINQQIPYLKHKLHLFEKSKELNEEQFRAFYHEYAGGMFESLEMEGWGPVKQFLDRKLEYSKVQEYFANEAHDCPSEISLLERSLSSNKEHLGLIKDRTYVSSWSIGTEQNLALWKLYGHGDDTVAITTSIEKLKKVAEENLGEMDELGYRAEVVEIQYIDKIHRPTEESLNAMRKVFSKLQWGHVASLAVKPKPYHYENEVRLIVFPIIGAHAIEQEAIELEINVKGGGYADLLLDGETSFIDEIYLPPNLTKESPQYKAVSEINEAFGVPNWRLKFDHIKMRNPFEED
jgi:hypothetical protein